MIDIGTKVYTGKENNPYIIHSTCGNFLLLGLEYPNEGCAIDECRLFQTKYELEKYIDDNPISRGYYVATWIDCY